jgi:hypothetical protein
MTLTPMALVEHVIPRVPVRQWVLSFPIPLRALFAAQTRFFCGLQYLCG